MKSKQITIRKMSYHDLPGVLAIERQQAFPWSETQFQESFGNFYENIVIEMKEGDIIKIIGFAVMQVVAEQGDLLNIAVNSLQRRKGYGSLLLREILQRGEQGGLKHIYLEVRASNSAALGLYERLGFKRIGLRKDYYRAHSGREDGISMEFVYN